MASSGLLSIEGLFVLFLPLSLLSVIMKVDEKDLNQERERESPSLILLSIHLFLHKNHQMVTFGGKDFLSEKIGMNKHSCALNLVNEPQCSSGGCRIICIRSRV